MVFMGGALVAVGQAHLLFPNPFFIPLPRSSDILSITFPRPRPLVDSDGEPTPAAKGGTGGADNALTKGSKRAGTKQCTRKK